MARELRVDIVAQGCAVRVDPVAVLVDVRCIRRRNRLSRQSPIRDAVMRRNREPVVVEAGADVTPIARKDVCGRRHAGRPSLCGRRSIVRSRLPKA